MVHLRLPAALAVLGALVAGPPGREPPLWGSVRLPGSVSAVRRILGLDASAGRMEAAGLLDLVRLAHGNNTNSKTPELIDRYLTAIDDFQTARRALPAGLVLPSSSTPKKDREAIQTLVELLGLRLRERRNVYSLEIEASDTAAERSGWMLANGMDVKQIISTTTTENAAPIELQDADLPLPLPDFWQQEIFNRKHLPILDITNDRQSSLLYVGLMALDDDTLAFLAAHLPLVRHLRDDHPGAFAAFGRSLRIHGGVVDVPGGAAAAPVWEALVGRAPSDAERFVRDLLGQDDGRLAYFYDTVDHLDAGRRAFALGGRLEAAARARFVKRVYDLFPATPEWTIADRPFYRPMFDGAIALSFVDVNADGTAGPPRLPSLLEQATGGGDWPTRADRVRADIKDRPADAAWLLEWTFESPKEAAARFRLFRFAQRVLPSGAIVGDRDDALDVALALRTWHEMPALARALERMGVGDLSTFGSIALSARRLTQSGGAGDVGPVLARWQSSLGLLEQADRLHPLPPATIAGLLKSLAEATPKSHDAADGLFAAWIAEQFVPAFVPAPDDHGDLEQAVVAALAGAPTPGAPKFSWEGLDYVVDTAGTVLKQVTAIRQTQQAPRLQDLVALQRVRRQIEKGVTTLDQLAPLVTEMTRLQTAVALLPQIDNKPPPIVHDYRDAVAELGKIKKAQDLKRASKALPDVARALDAMTDAVIEPLVYALAATPTDQPSQTVAAAWRAHTFLPGSSADQRPWTSIAWQTAEAEGGAQRGLILRGSYLNLDIPLANSRLPQVPIDSSVPAKITGEDKSAVVQAIGLGVPPHRPADDLDAVVAALVKGRALAEQWAQAPPDRLSLRASLRGAAVDEWRTNVMIWTTENNPRQAFASLRTTEMYFLGGGTNLPVEFGWPASTIDGCLCRLPPSRRAPEDLRARVGAQAAAIDSDLLLRIAEDLTALKLPPRLARLLLPMMTADWINHVQQVAAYDWEALASWPSAVPSAKVEDALLHLVAMGLLSPPRDGHAPGPR
jgi:hypothetical protein